MPSSHSLDRLSVAFDELRLVAASSTPYEEILRR